MTDGPINPDREQQRADNLASRRQSHFGPLPEELERERTTRSTDEAGEEDASGEGGESGEAGEP